MLKEKIFGIVLMLLLISIAILTSGIQPVKASGTIHIRADGSVEGTDKIVTVDNVTYTFTNNINDSIIVERDNIVIDGAGYTLQGTGGWTSIGIYLLGRTNVTIRNTQIKNFGVGIWLNLYSDYNKVTGNNLTDNRFAIELDSSSHNSITGNNITNNGNGIWLDTFSNHNSISGNNITASEWDAIGLTHESSNNSISENNITNNGYSITIDSNSNNNSISRNNINASVWGIWLDYHTNYTSISGNNITNNECGIWLSRLSYTNITRNNITNNERGIWLDRSPNNNVSGNTITNNSYGVWLDDSSNNKFWHNNFINNTQQVNMTQPVYTNTWDDNYPSGGNYWSNYSDVDLYNGPHQNLTGSDGIDDTPHEINADNKDRYPLMAPYSTFDTGTWNGTPYNVDIVGNSTVSGFQVNPSQKTISFNVTGVEGTAGFCRITIPNIIVQDLWDENYTVLLNGVPQPFRNWTDATNTYIYFNYTHSEHQITIIPEFPSTIILSLFMVFSVIAIVFAKKKRKKQKPNFQTLFLIQTNVLSTP